MAAATSTEDDEPYHLLIIEARFYTDIADMLAQGALQALEHAGATQDRIEVPGALEIPGVISMALDSDYYDGYIALGCVIRGETSHYDVVAGESARGLMQLAVRDGACIGNGILTVENRQQAEARADPQQKNKGAEAARAALRLLQIRERFERLGDDNDD